MNNSILCYLAYIHRHLELSVADASGVVTSAATNPQNAQCVSLIKTGSCLVRELHELASISTSDAISINKQRRSKGCQNLRHLPELIVMLVVEQRTTAGHIGFSLHFPCKCLADSCDPSGARRSLGPGQSNLVMRCFRIFVLTTPPIPYAGTILPIRAKLAPNQSLRTIRHLSAKGGAFGCPCGLLKRSNPRRCSGVEKSCIPAGAKNCAACWLPSNGAR